MSAVAVILLALALASLAVCVWALVRVVLSIRWADAQMHVTFFIGGVAAVATGMFAALASSVWS